MLRERLGMLDGESDDNGFGFLEERECILRIFHTTISMWLRSSIIPVSGDLNEDATAQ
jgi:hypothetical protein